MTLELNEVIIIVVVILVGAACISWARGSEKRKWNKGVCECGNPWRYFDSDSQGGRGYICDHCHEHIWISYNVDKEVRKHGSKA